MSEQDAARLAEIRERYTTGGRYLGEADMRYLLDLVASLEQRAATAEQDVERLSRNLSAAVDDYNTSQREAQRLRVELAQALADLRLGFHDEGCALHADFDSKCDCTHDKQIADAYPPRDLEGQAP